MYLASYRYTAVAYFTIFALISATNLESLPVFLSKIVKITVEIIFSLLAVYVNINTYR